MTTQNRWALFDAWRRFPHKLLPGYLFGGLTLVALLWIACGLGSDPRLNYLLIIFGATLGWTIGILISPHLKEKSRFKDLLGIISAFITGFLLSKINATIDKQIDAILTNPIFIGQMLLFGSSFLLGALFVFVGRQYWRDEDEYQAVSTVQVASNPDGADVYSDGAFVGNAPSTLKLSPGKHTVRVTSSGYKDWSREITVQPGSEVKLNAVLEKEQVPTLRKEREGWGTPS